MSNSNAAGFAHFWMIEIDKCSVGWGKSGQVDRYLSRWLQLCWNLLAEGTSTGHTCIELSVSSLRNTKIFMLQEHDTEEHKDRISLSLHFIALWWVPKQRLQHQVLASYYCEPISLESVLVWCRCTYHTYHLSLIIADSDYTFSASCLRTCE